ncbi:hypothetical protein [Bradyrhizobium sp. STM 3809]|uniref:hypothetical protein n=1 Tax=Bradyrhizobium sp. STM 3809 TaxID=551936 RepID=UPI001111E53F|nr:hypothetical protein [Bradyrhizobium sp. STM 3809]
MKIAGSSSKSGGNERVRTTFRPEPEQSLDIDAIHKVDHQHLDRHATPSLTIGEQQAFGELIHTTRFG